MEIINMVRSQATQRVLKAFLAALCLGLPMLGQAEFKGHLSVYDAIAKIEAGKITAIDVRQPEEYTAGHVPGAINVPHDQIEQYVEQIQDLRQQPVLIYCRSGRRAVLAEQTLAELGFTNLYHMQGDMLGWQESKLPVHSPAEH
jgi:rhodanese-related sulfurtransferase